MKNKIKEYIDRGYRIKIDLSSNKEDIINIIDMLIDNKNIKIKAYKENIIKDI